MPISTASSIARLPPRSKGISPAVPRARRRVPSAMRCASAYGRRRRTIARRRRCGARCREMVRSVTQSAPASGRRISLRQASLARRCGGAGRPRLRALAGAVARRRPNARAGCREPRRLARPDAASLPTSLQAIATCSSRGSRARPTSHRQCAISRRTDSSCSARVWITLADRQAAAVVYRIRNHYVSLFVWRAADPRPEPVEVATVRGFAVATWADGGVRFAAVSDVDRRDLERFAALATAIR